MTKIKNSDSKSIWNDNASSGKAGSLNEKDKTLPEIIAEIEKIKPYKEPAIAKKLPNKFASLSLFLNNKEPIAPMANRIIKLKKLIADVIISVMLFYFFLLTI